MDSQVLWLNFVLCTVAMLDRFLNTLMMCGTQVSLSNNTETLNLSKEEHVKLFLGINMHHMLLLWPGGCQFDFLFERRENHRHRLAEGLPNNEWTKLLLPPSIFECHCRSRKKYTSSPRYWYMSIGQY